MSEESIRAYFLTGVTADALESLLRGGSWPWLYAERMEATELCFLAEAMAGNIPWQRWRHGRVFDPQSELSWQRQPDGRYHLRLLTTVSPPQTDRLDWGDADEWPAAGRQTATLLHGIRNDEPFPDGKPRWSEARLPRYLAYPVTEAAPPERVALVTQAYWQSRTTLATRLVAVQGVTQGDRK